MSKKKFQGNSLNWIGVWHNEKQDTFTSAVIQVKELEGLKGAVRITLRPNVNRKNEKSPAYIAKIEEQFSIQKEPPITYGNQYGDGVWLIERRRPWTKYEDLVDGIIYYPDFTPHFKYEQIDYSVEGGYYDEPCNTFEEAFERFNRSGKVTPKEKAKVLEVLEKYQNSKSLFKGDK